MRVPSALPLALLLGGALAACSQTPMPPLMSPISQVTDFGYSDRDLGKDRVEVVYLGPSQRVSTWRASRQEAVDEAKAQADELATWRAAQIALARGKPAFEVVDRHTNLEVDIRDYYDPYPWGWPAFGYYPYPYRWRGPYYPAFYPGVSNYRDARAQAEAKLTVQLLDKMQPGALDSQATADRLSRKYGAAAGQRPTPESAAPKSGGDALPKQGT